VKETALRIQEDARRIDLFRNTEVERDRFVRDRHKCCSNLAVYPEGLLPHNRYNYCGLWFAVGRGGNDLRLAKWLPL
jgi:hypothetical protein